MVSRTISRVKRESGISLETPQWKRASCHVEGIISWIFSSCSGKLGVPLKLRLEPEGPTRVTSRKSSLHVSCEGPLGIPLQSVPDPRSSSGAEAATSDFLFRADMVLGIPMEFPQGVMPRPGWRHASPLSSRAVTVVSGFLSS